MGPVERVDDPADPRVDDYRDLTDADLRRREEPAAGLFMVEGPAIIRFLLASRYPLRSLLLTEHRFEELAADLVAAPGDWPVYVAPTAVMRGITGFQFHRGALGAANRTPPTAWRDLVTTPLLVVAEGIGDHENLGALFRNAAAFGAGAVLLSPTCVDPLYRRAVRVSMGHVLRMPWARLDPWPAALEELRARGSRVVALTPDRSAPAIETLDRQGAGPLALVVGAEGAGLSSGARTAAGQLVRIPMAAGVDSLNVATAAAIALHHFSPLRSEARTL